LFLSSLSFTHTDTHRHTHIHKLGKKTEGKKGKCIVCQRSDYLFTKEQSGLQLCLLLTDREWSLLGLPEALAVLGKGQMIYKAKKLILHP
jgi:hypothetical protein